MSNIPLGPMTAEDFLANYWQKKPVLIRQAFPNFKSPITADELAGLALEDGVMSRLILEKNGDYPWQLKHGPLEADTFDTLGDSHWTVLVQEVDRHVPAVADLFDHFHFLPNWRKDDVMISFASNDAGVGAHVDSYDVFLLQGSGRRRWSIGPANPHPKYIDGLDIRVIENFQPSETYELEAGDMLYIPPGVPHEGTALEPCLTFSFGFLAPTRADIVSDFADWYEHRRGTIRYADPDLLETTAPGLISEDDINRVLRLLQQVACERELVAEWFGSFITRPQRGPAETEEFEGTSEEFVADFKDCEVWRRHEAVRVAGYLENANMLFVNGEEVATSLTAEQIGLLVNKREIKYSEVAGNQALMEVMYLFTTRGWGYLSGTEDE